MSQTSARREWSSLEDSLLREAVKRCKCALHFLTAVVRCRLTSSGRIQKGTLCWNLIAAHVPGRDRKSCHKRWNYKIGTDFNVGSWTSEEDAKLMRGVEQCGERWSLVATYVQTRNGDQCLQRWRNYLDPSINKAPWSEEEDRLLQEAISKYGHNWTLITQNFFSNRSRLSVRNREQALRNKQSLIENAKAIPPVLFMND